MRYFIGTPAAEPWVLVCGMKAEARLFANLGSCREVIVGGGDSRALERRLSVAPAWPILSIGIAGALDPALAVGDVAIDGEPELLQRLQAAWPDAKAGVIHGQDTIAATAEGKAALRRATGALAIDMESHVARAAAERQGVSFAAVRVISDTANDTLPPAALVGMKPDGGMALGAVLGSLVREPRQLPALIRTGINAGKAMRVLGRVHHALERSGVFRLDLR